MIDVGAFRAVLTARLVNTGLQADLADLSDLGAMHAVVLEMLAERILELHAVGYSKADIHVALSDDVVRMRQHRHATNEHGRS